MSSSCLTKTGVQEICRPLPESPGRLALQAGIYTGATKVVFTYTEGYGSAHGALQTLCCSLFSAQGSACLSLALILAVHVAL